MEGINRGTTLGGRYRVEEQLAGPDGTTRWSATDTTLGREVTVLAFPSSHPHAEDARDCALRLAGVEDPRLGKVLDVGADGDLSYVVLDAQHHGSSLARLLREDTVPAEEVRRIAGEAALALEAARQRGLHHGVLTPHDLLRQPTGGVVVSGVAVNASLAGQDDTSGDDSTRADVVALVRCVYAGLTGRWPGPGEINGLPSVRRRADGHVPAPGELVTGVPSDLDTLCRTVLNDDEGPRNPGELARQISPWSSEPVQGTGGRVAAGPGGPDGIRLPSSPAGSLAAATGDETVVAALPTMMPRPAGPDDATVIGRRPELDHDETTAYRPRADASPYVEEELEPPLPLLDAGRDEPDRSSSRLALGIVAGITVLALLAGLFGLKSMFGGRGDDGGDNSPTPAAPSSPSAAGSRSPSAAAAAGAASSVAPGTAIPVASATSYDPQGDGNEHNETARRAIDDDPGTEWITHRYKVATYTRNGKQGSGLALDLGGSRQVHTVRVTVAGSPIGAAVYVGDRPQVSAAAKLGDLSGSDTQVVSSSQGRTGRYVLIWVDRLGRVSGGYRAQIAEVEVLS